MKLMLRLFFFMVAVIVTATKVEAGIISFAKATEFSQKNIKSADNFFIDSFVGDRALLITSLKKTDNSSVFQLLSHGRPGLLFINGAWLDPKKLAIFLKRNLPVQNRYIAILIFTVASLQKERKALLL